MVDIEQKGGVQVIVKTLMEAGLLNGDTLTCTVETLAEQMARLDTGEPDGTVVYGVESPLHPHVVCVYWAKISRLILEQC